MTNDPFKSLRDDHRKVARLFKEIESAGNDAKGRLFEQLKTELRRHADIEEEYMYPLLEASEETKELVQESHEEHGLVRTLLAEMESQTVGSAGWHSRLQEMKEHVEYHVTEEEEELFPEAEDLLSEEDLEEMAQNLHQARATAAAPAPEARSR